MAVTVSFSVKNVYSNSADFSYEISGGKLSPPIGDLSDDDLWTRTKES
ncbi:MAG: hypothetical protein NC548_25640 [Lachnospiraceae bacterium]|nr:hypothetical protein [Lachnospiraceae bacterium]